MKKSIFVYLFALISMPSMAQMTTPQDTLLAFPGAEGFGKFTSGGRGGKVVYVTSLADDANGATSGTLRWAMKQYPGEPLTVCFAVTGEIRLVSQLDLQRRSNFTWAGQTAPGMGIVITHNKVKFNGSNNFIVRNIRFRIGNEDASGKFLNASAVGAENCENYIFDHCDFGWSSEENMNTNDSHFITIQYCIVHEGLYDAGNGKGARGYGCQWGGSPATYHHNLLANNNGRSCRFNGAQSNDWVVYLDYINNVNYNYYGGSTGCHGGENTAKLAEGEYNGLNSVHECNFINNYYKKGPNTTNTMLFFRANYNRSGKATSWGPSHWYVSGNIMDGRPSATLDNWSAITSESASVYPVDTFRVDTLIRTQTPWWRWTADSVYGRYDFDIYAYSVSEYETADQAFQTVLDTVGVFPRDHVELRLINDTRNGTHTYVGGVAKKKGIIDNVSDAEGFYNYTVVEPFTDTDQDGMPDFWELSNGMNPAVPDQNTIDPATGYTMLEVYLDYAMHHREPMDDGYIEPTALHLIQVDKRLNGRYNLLGQPVDEDYKGVMIENNKLILK